MDYMILNFRKRRKVFIGTLLFFVAIYVGSLFSVFVKN